MPALATVDRIGVTLPTTACLLAVLERECANAGGGAAELVAAARHHGITALLDADPHALARSDERGLLAETCHRDALEASMWELLHRTELTRVLARLADSGVPSVLLKGTPLSLTHYPQPAMRLRSDTDLLIRLDDRVLVAAILEDMGYARMPGAEGRFVSYQGEWMRVDAHGADHFLDVHWRVSNTQLLAQALEYDELARDAVSVPQLGAAARAPKPAHALLLAAMHRATHLVAPYRVGTTSRAGDRLIWLVDIHLLVSAMHAEERAEFVALAERKKMVAVCQDALAATARAFGTPGIETFAPAWSAGTAFEPSALLLQGDGLRRAVGEYRALARWRDRFTLLREQLLPSARYMRWRYAHARVQWLPWLYASRALRACGGRLTVSRKPT